MNPNITVLYTTGAYGSFISWIFYTFSNLNKDNIIKSPLNGSNAHGYRDTLASSNIVSPVDVGGALEFCQGCQNVLVLEYNNFDQSVNYINNIVEKCFANDINEYLKSLFPDYKDVIIKNWGEFTDINIREFLSLIIPALINSNLSKFQNQISGINNKQNKKIHSISPEELLIDISNNGIKLKELFDFFELTPNNYFPAVNKIVYDYISLQKFFTRSTDLDSYFLDILYQRPSLQNLTIVDQAFIQQKLWKTDLSETTRDYVYNTLGYTYREIQNDK